MNGNWTPVTGAQGTTSTAGLLKYCGGELHAGAEVRLDVAIINLPLRDGPR